MLTLFPRRQKDHLGDSDVTIEDHHTYLIRGSVNIRCSWNSFLLLLPPHVTWLSSNQSSLMISNGHKAFLRMSERLLLPYFDCTSSPHKHQVGDWKFKERDLPLNYSELTHEGKLREHLPPALFLSGENFHLPFDFQVDHQYWISQSGRQKYDESLTNKAR